MLNKIALIFILSCAFSVVQAQAIDINPDNPGTYVVEKGDTLWGISERFLQEPWRWPEIWQGNPQIEDPHLIYPGDIVTLSYEDGSPVLSVERSVVDTDTDVGDSSSAGVARRTVRGRNVKLSPTIIEYQREQAIPSIPIDAIRHFLSRPLVVSEGEMEDWPYIVASHQNHMAVGKGGRVYVRGIAENSGTSAYSLYRLGPAYISDGDTLGYEALHIGEALVERTGDPATAVIVESDREILVGDRLLPQPEDDVSADFIPHSPGNNVSGQIISVVDGVSEIGQYQIVVLDRGEQDGLEDGNVLGIYQSGRAVQDKTAVKYEGIAATPLAEYMGRPKAAGETVILPETYAGVLMVFRTFERISYALVMEASGPLHMNDRVKSF